MIGHYLLTLTEEQEDRVLGNPMTPGRAYDPDGRRCLWGVARDIRPRYGSYMPDQAEKEDHLLFWPHNWYTQGMPRPVRMVGETYDNLCERFGTDRINAAIRNRILSNRANRTLRNAPQLTEVA